VLEFVNKFRVAHHVISEGYYRPGFHFLSVSFDLLSRALALPPHARGRISVLLFILNAACEVAADFDLPDVLAMLFRHLAPLAEHALGARHPTALIARRFEGLGHAGRVAMLADLRTEMAACPVYAAWSRAGKRNEVAFQVYDASMDLWAGENTQTTKKTTTSSSLSSSPQGDTSRRSSTASPSIPHGLQRLLCAWDVVQQDATMALWMHFRSAILALSHGTPFDAVLADLQREYPALQVERRAPYGVSLMLGCYRLRGGRALVDGREALAESMCRDSVGLVEAAWGPKDRACLEALEDLYRVLLLRGKGPEAEAVWADRQSRIRNLSEALSM